MVDLKALADTIRQLSPEERQQLDRLVEAENQMEPDVVPPQIIENIETLMRNLNNAFAAMREGLTDQELDELVELMNVEHIEDEEA